MVAKVGGRKRYTRHDAAAALLERVKESTRGLKESGDPIRAIRTKIDACLDATPIFSSGWMDRQDRIVKAAAAVTGALTAEARRECSRRTPGRGGRRGRWSCWGRVVASHVVGGGCVGEWVTSGRPGGGVGLSA